MINEPSTTRGLRGGRPVSLTPTCLRYRLQTSSHGIRVAKVIQRFLKFRCCSNGVLKQSKESCAGLTYKGVGAHFFLAIFINPCIYIPKYRYKYLIIKYKMVFQQTLVRCKFLHVPHV